jgi:hypothetical protein
VRKSLNNKRRRLPLRDLKECSMIPIRSMVPSLKKLRSSWRKKMNKNNKDLMKVLLEVVLRSLESLERKINQLLQINNKLIPRRLAQKQCQSLIREVLQVKAFLKMTLSS